MSVLVLGVRGEGPLFRREPWGTWVKACAVRVLWLGVRGKSPLARRLVRVRLGLNRCNVYIIILFSLYHSHSDPDSLDHFHINVSLN